MRRAKVCAMVLACITAMPLARASVSSGPRLDEAPNRQRPDFTANVEMVLLNVAVIDPRGGVVPELVPEDFRVYDDGVRQEIELFLTPADAPLDIGLVLDSSSSMSPVAATARRAALTFLGLLEPNDCVYVLPFTETVGTGRWGRPGDPALWSFIERIETTGGTSLYDALLAGMAVLERNEIGELVARGAAGDSTVEPGDAAGEARIGAPVAATASSNAPPQATVGKRGQTPPDVERKEPERPPLDLPPRKLPLSTQLEVAVRRLDLSAPPPVSAGCGAALPDGPFDPTASRRRALVVLSDGADENSDATFYESLAAARAASVPVFPVALGYANEDQHLKERLGELARATGGRMIESLAPARLRESYSNVVTMLRGSYLLGYDPTAKRAPQPDAGVVAGAREPLSPPPGQRRRPVWHEIQVELRRPNFEALVRPGYYR